MSDKKTFAERYPNHRTETRDERITHMTPAHGWWKIHVYQCHYAAEPEQIEFSYEVYPVAFFAQVEYEERSVWDHGSSSWKKEVITIAHTAGNEEWELQVMESPQSNSCDEKLFYDPDYRLGNSLEYSLTEWVSNVAKFNKELELERIKRKKEKAA